MSTKQEKEINNYFLIVDDQEQIATMQAMILIRNGYKNIYTVNSGRKALSMLKQFPIDFIITDWHMPNMSGIELLISIRKNQQYQNIPVLMLTEEMSQEKVIYAIEEGVDGYQEKPFSEKAMLKAIQNIFYKKSHPNALQSQRQRLLCLQLQKKYDEALSLATEILNTSESIDALFVSSECYFYKKQLKRAKAYIQKALKIKQEGKFLNLLGKIYMAEEKPEKAIAYFKKASLMNPLNFNRKIEIGNAYLKLGLMDEASETFSHIKELEPTDLKLYQYGISLS